MRNETGGTILDRINATKREEIAALKASFRGNAGQQLAAQCVGLPPTRPFAAVLSAPPLRLIAEVKRASPSKGVIRADFDPVAVAEAYERGGATCLSVLTDETYFGGHLSYLAAIREAVSLPLLRKDFVLDPVQIYEARLAGADAVLLIAASLPSAARLAELRHVAASVGMDALVEVHNEVELALAIESGATLIGVNNRDLHTFAVSLDVSVRLIPLLPIGTIAVSESGIFTHDDLQTVAGYGAGAVLVGESLMRQANIEAATRALLGG